MTQSTGGRWPQIVLIYLVGVFGMLVVSSALPALGGIAAEFHPPSASAIGWVMSIPALAAVLASLLIGWMVDRFGDRSVMLSGGVLVLVGDLGAVLAADFAMLLGWRFVTGLGYVGMVVAAVAMITRMTQGRQRIAALALWSTVIPASFVAASLYGVFAGGGTNWRAAFLWHGGGTAVLLVLAWAILAPRTSSDQVASRLSGIGAVLRSPWPYVLGASFAAAAFLQTGFVATLPRILTAAIGTSEAQVHSFNILAMLCNMAGAYSFGVLLNRGVQAWLIGSGAVVLCAAAGLGLILAPTALIPAVVMNCALMTGLGLLVGMWAIMPQVAPSPTSIGATSGLITQITVLGVLFGPPVAFKALAAGTSGLLLLLGAALVGCMIGWPVWARAHRAENPSSHGG